MLDFETYRKNYFTSPIPEPRYRMVGLGGITLFFSEYEKAIEYYALVLGPPGYVEGEDVRGWRIGSGWLTLLKSNQGDPQNTEFTILMETVEDAERLHAAFIKHGGQGNPPSDELMYEPIRYCSVVDPFGTSILIISRHHVQGDDQGN